MRGRKPLPLRIGPDEAPIWQPIARRRSLPWSQNPAGSHRPGRRPWGADPTPGHPDAVRPHDYREDRPPLGGRGPARPAGTTATHRTARPDCPPPARPDRPVGLPGASGPGAAPHPLVEQGPGPSGRRRRKRVGPQRPVDSHAPQRGGPPAAPHPVLEDGPVGRRVQAARREDPLGRGEGGRLGRRRRWVEESIHSGPRLVARPSRVVARCVRRPLPLTGVVV